MHEFVNQLLESYAMQYELNNDKHIEVGAQVPTELLGRWHTTAYRRDVRTCCAGAGADVSANKIGVQSQSCDDTTVPRTTDI